MGRKQVVSLKPGFFLFGCSSRIDWVWGRFPAVNHSTQHWTLGLLQLLSIGFLWFLLPWVSSDGQLWKDSGIKASLFPLQITGRTGRQRLAQAERLAPTVQGTGKLGVATSSELEAFLFIPEIPLSLSQALVLLLFEDIPSCKNNEHPELHNTGAWR